MADRGSFPSAKSRLMKLEWSMTANEPPSKAGYSFLSVLKQ